LCLQVICYYSAGSSENWRPDFGQFSKSDLGTGLEGWQGENYVNMRSAAVLEIMKNRIKQAADKGCDAIDPDNMGKHSPLPFSLCRLLTLQSDVYSNGGGGFSLTQTDAVNYLKSMSSYAATLGLSTGLKNAQEILPQVISDIAFAVNEECVTQKDRNTKCTEYNDLIAAGKPVLHIEYVNNGSSKKTIVARKALARIAGIEGSKGVAGAGIGKETRDMLCNVSINGARLSTVIKYLSLDGWVLYCDGSEVTTAVNASERTGRQPEDATPVPSDGGEGGVDVETDGDFRV
jgi:hypothetical protein